MTKKIKSTSDTHYASLSPERKKEFDQGYKDLLISEILLAAMEEDDISVRELATAAGLSPTIVQGLRSGTRKNVNIKSFFKILNALGYSLSIEKNGSHYPLDIHNSDKR